MFALLRVAAAALPDAALDAHRQLFRCAAWHQLWRVGRRGRPQPRPNHVSLARVSRAVGVDLCNLYVRTASSGPATLCALCRSRKPANKLTAMLLAVCVYVICRRLNATNRSLLAQVDLLGRGRDLGVQQTGAPPDQILTAIPDF